MNAPDGSLWVDDMAWAVPQYPRNQVDNAGFVLADPNACAADLERAFTVINNWRSAHNYPLNTFQVTLRNKSKRIESVAPLVAQRIKRLESITAKLRRQPTLQLSQMQDIGGCRSVVSSLKKATELVEAYKNARFEHEFQGSKNYIESPKPDGYRSYHLIYRYKGTPRTAAYNKLRIEIQIRSRMQHAWATAVEAVGTFTNQALKSNQGSADWKRFFALMGSALARLERAQSVPGTPTSRQELKDELTHLANALRVQNTLQSYSATLNYIGGQRAAESKFFLVRLDPSAQQVTVQGFPANASQQANLTYTALERELEGSKEQVVLVSVDTIAALKRAYPNYFMDTQVFGSLLTRVLV